MQFMTDEQRGTVSAMSQLAYSNPFLPERIDSERQALGILFKENQQAWNLRPEQEDEERENIRRLKQFATDLAEDLRGKLIAGVQATDVELGLYEDLVHVVLYYRYRDALTTLVEEISPGAERIKSTFYDDFSKDAEHFLGDTGHRFESLQELPHLFALSYQLRRAFWQIFRHIIGQSGPTVALRGAVWESIFTHDMRRYRRHLYTRMGELATLIMGPSGTGKELVARAIGISRYIPFDPQSRSFASHAQDTFFSINLSALSPTLIESELFGHRKGAFTGALQDRVGFFEASGKLGTVFLDEIGEITGSIQVKLLRVLQTRNFQRIGDTETRNFRGKVIAATNRRLHEEIQAGTFRPDLYYRLCSDVIEMPSLRERLLDDPAELVTLLRFISTRVAGPDEAPKLSEEVLKWITNSIPSHYAWPGNVRELEQCVRNVLVHRSYRPPTSTPNRINDQYLSAFTRGTLTADEVLRYYCTRIYAETHSYESAARKLKLDRRTVKSKVDDGLLKELQSIG